MTVRDWLEQNDRWLYGMGVTVAQAAALVGKEFGRWVATTEIEQALDDDACDWFTGEGWHIRCDRRWFTSKEWQRLNTWFRTAEFVEQGDPACYLRRRVYEECNKLNVTEEAIAEMARLRNLQLKESQHG